MHMNKSKGEREAKRDPSAALNKEVHERVRNRPAASKGGSEVGNERHADVRGAQEGGSRAEASHNPLTHAVRELHEQHPIHYADDGPHHGTDHHIRHEPMHGLHPGRHAKGQPEPGPYGNRVRREED